MARVLFDLQYMLKTMVYPRENEFMREIRQITNEHVLYAIPLPSPVPRELQIMVCVLEELQVTVG